MTPRHPRRTSRQGIPRGLQVDTGLRHSLEASSVRRSLLFAAKTTKPRPQDVSLTSRRRSPRLSAATARKTTLLKILSRITRPTTGFAESTAASFLLEVAPLHPSLPAAKTRSSPAPSSHGKAKCRKFDEIVAFAELEKFIDTPVKHYSSGMYVRCLRRCGLFEPEILLVDEVSPSAISTSEKCSAKWRCRPRRDRRPRLPSAQSDSPLCHRVV